MTDEDEEFNRIERESKQRMESVVSICRVTTPEDVRRITKPWQGLTDDERRAVRNSVYYTQFMTAGEYAEHVQEATESLLKAKNEM